MHISIKEGDKKFNSVISEQKKFFLLMYECGFFSLIYPHARSYHDKVKELIFVTKTDIAPLQKSDFCPPSAPKSHHLLN